MGKKLFKVKVDCDSKSLDYCDKLCFKGGVKLCGKKCNKVTLKVKEQYCIEYIQSATQTVAPGQTFAINNPILSNKHIKLSGNNFTLEEKGTYKITVQTSYVEVGSILLYKDGSPLTYTITGKSSAEEQVTLNAIVLCNNCNSVISVNAYASNAGSLTTLANTINNTLIIIEKIN